MIKPSTEVKLIRHDGEEVWRGPLINFFMEHRVRAPRQIIDVFVRLGESGKADHGGLFTLKLVGG